MRFVNVWSYKCAYFLAQQLNENHQKRHIFYYGFQMIIGELVKTVILVIVSLLLGTFVPTLVVLLTFGLLRLAAGGYHMDTYGKCMVTSIGLFVAAGAIAQYTHQFWNPYVIFAFLALSFVVGLPVLIKWAPGDTPNKPITRPEQIRRLKNISIIYTFVWIIISLILFYFGHYKFVIATTFGYILEVFTVSPAGYRFFDMISNMGRKTKAKKR